MGTISCVFKSSVCSFVSDGGGEMGEDDEVSMGTESSGYGLMTP